MTVPDERADALRNLMDQHLPEADPSGRSKIEHLWDTAAPWIVAVLAMLFVVSVIGNFVLEWDANKSQNNHHAQTVESTAQTQKLIKEVLASQTDHATTLMEIKSLATAVNSVIAGLPAADTYLAQLATGLEGQITALCTATHADCPGLPAPKS